MERGELELVLAVDSAGQIAGLLLQPPAGQFSEARFEEIGSRLEAAIRADDAKALGADFSESTEKAIPESSRRNLLSQLRSQFGKLKERKAVTHPSSNTATWRLVYDRGEVDLKVALDQEGKIAGIWFLPSARAALSFAPPLNTVCLRLPFRGMWMALWGGETAEDNAHHDIENQRYAIDWVGIDDEGRRTRPSSAGLENEDFLAYGREILAPSSAEVTDVIDGVRDNLPGSMNPYSALGNSVTLRLARDQFAVLAHLQPGSIRVRPGQRVEAGEVVGLCGNSGESSEPHLHFHIQHTPILQDGVGVRSFFETVVLLSTPCCRIRSDYSPVRWDVVLAD